jgi:hypothetical protein
MKKIEEILDQLRDRPLIIQFCMTLQCALFVYIIIIMICYALISEYLYTICLAITLPLHIKLIKSSWEKTKL